jgi:hypothetical protein
MSGFSRKVRSLTALGSVGRNEYTDLKKAIEELQELTVIDVSNNDGYVSISRSRNSASLDLDLSAVTDALDAQVLPTYYQSILEELAAALQTLLDAIEASVPRLISRDGSVTIQAGDGTDPDGLGVIPDGQVALDLAPGAVVTDVGNEDGLIMVTESAPGEVVLAANLTEILNDLPGVRSIVNTDGYFSLTGPDEAGQVTLNTAFPEAPLGVQSIINTDGFLSVTGPDTNGQVSLGVDLNAIAAALAPEEPGEELDVPGSVFPYLVGPGYVYYSGDSRDYLLTLPAGDGSTVPSDPDAPIPACLRVRMLLGDGSRGEPPFDIWPMKFDMDNGGLTTFTEVVAGQEYTTTVQGSMTNAWEDTYVSVTVTLFRSADTWAARVRLTETRPEFGMEHGDAVPAGEAQFVWTQPELLRVYPDTGEWGLVAGISICGAIQSSGVTEHCTGTHPDVVMLNPDWSEARRSNPRFEVIVAIGGATLTEL